MGAGRPGGDRERNGGRGPGARRRTGRRARPVLGGRDPVVPLGGPERLPARRARSGFRRRRCATRRPNPTGGARRAACPLRPMARPLPCGPVAPPQGREPVAVRERCRAVVVDQRPSGASCARLPGRCDRPAEAAGRTSGDRGSGPSAGEAVPAAASTRGGTWRILEETHRHRNRRTTGCRAEVAGGLGKFLLVAGSGWAGPGRAPERGPRPGKPRPKAWPRRVRARYGRVDRPGPAVPRS